MVNEVCLKNYFKEDNAKAANIMLKFLWKLKAVTLLRWMPVGFTFGLLITDSGRCCRNVLRTSEMHDERIANMENGHLLSSDSSRIRMFSGRICLC